jgi:hypothetical protein
MKRASKTHQKELAELLALVKEQQEALQDSIYLRPSEKQATEYEERRSRITELRVRLSPRAHSTAA